MKYSNDFVSEVKRVYPNNREMHRLAEEGNYFLGRYLDDSSQGGISVDEILLATSLESIQNKARELKRKKQLYARWFDESLGIRTK